MGGRKQGGVPDGTCSEISKAIEMYGDLKTAPQRQEVTNIVTSGLAQSRGQDKDKQENLPSLQEHQGDHFQSQGGQPDITTQVTALLHELLKGIPLNPNFDFQPKGELIWNSEQTILQHPEISKDWRLALIEYAAIMEDIALTRPNIEPSDDERGYFCNTFQREKEAIEDQATRKSSAIGGEAVSTPDGERLCDRLASIQESRRQQENTPQGELRMLRRLQEIQRTTRMMKCLHT